MKKHLLSTSAIALGVAMASPAAAQQWNLDWGGFYKGHVAAADVSGSGTDGADFDGVGVYSDGELHFKPSITLDNGLTVGADVELEANNSRHIDESYLYITSDTLGLIRIGQDNSAGYQSMVAAPTVTSIWINSPSSSAFIPRTGNLNFREAAISSYTEVEGGNDIPRLTYFTPSFNGLTVGVSYTPVSKTSRSRNFPEVGDPESGDRDAEGSVNDVFDIGVKYSQSFGGVDINLGARWGTGDRTAVAAIPAGATFEVDPDTGTIVPSDAVAGIPGGDPTTWGIGGQIGANGFLLGASYAENDRDISGTNAGNAEGWTLGATYDIPGPWSVEALTVQGEVKNGAGRSDDKYEAYRVGAARNLGPGVKWEVYYIYSETKNGLNGNKIEGNVIGTGVGLNF